MCARRTEQFQESTPRQGGQHGRPEATQRDLRRLAQRELSQAQTSRQDQERRARCGGGGCASGGLGENFRIRSQAVLLTCQGFAADLAASLAQWVLSSFSSVFFLLSSFFFLLSSFFFFFFFFLLFVFFFFFFFFPSPSSSPLGVGALNVRLASRELSAAQ